ncbi:MAG: DUF3078 domain-containing protein [Paludibacter sp.]|nr:DUF3078 domain-containing protein [Paludibacter sp.]
MKIKKCFLWVVLTSFSFATFAQITEGEKKLKAVATDTVVGWKKGIATSLNFSQTALINWSAGGEDSYALNAMLGMFANYKNEKSAWDNSLDMGYGLLNQGDEEMKKTDDRIELTSKYGRKAVTSFYWAGLLNFKTQFMPGYKYTDDTETKISNFLAPGYLVGALGMNYKPNNYFSAFLAPVTGKLTIVNDEDLSAEGAYGVDPGKKSRSEFGGYARLNYARNDFKNEWLKNISLSSKLDLFSNYLDKPQNIDVSWENIILMKVNKYIGISLNTNLLYDADIIDPVSGKAKVQFKEILGVGFSLKF